MNIKALSIAACAIALMAQNAAAVPARRGVVFNVRQPDGTTLAIMREGDERSHLTTTADGIPVVDLGDGAGYCYATTDALGQLVSTGITALDSNRRTQAHRSVIASINLADTRRAAAAPAKRPATPQHNPGLNTSTFVAKGEMHALVILVNYTDKKMTVANPAEFFSRMCNEERFADYRATGSVRDYFKENSLGAFSPIFDVYGPVELSKPMRYYGQNDFYGDDMRAHEMAIEALRVLVDDGTVNPDDYDFDNDGYIDNVYVIYAGLPESGAGSSSTVWPHSWDIEELDNYDELYDLTYGTKRLNHYACSSELETAATPDGIGTIVHEFSHVLGLPDLYSTAGSSGATPGCWSVLDQGCYNNDSRTPVGYSMFERYALDWIKPLEIDRPADVTLLPLTQGHGAIIRTPDKNEYFLLENRTATSWDAYIAAEGMLVWHIDYDEDRWAFNSVNNDAKHQCVDLVEADGTSGCYEGSNAGNPGGDPFPGNRKITTFTPTTWDNTDLDLPLTEITRANGLITFKVKGGGPASLDPAESAGPTISVSGREIAVDGVATGTPVTVRDIAGRLAAQSAAPAAITVGAPGIYVVTAGTTVAKVAVR